MSDEKSESWDGEVAEEVERFLRVGEARGLVEIGRLEDEEGEVAYAGEVARRTGLDPAFLSTRLDDFEERGLVSRERELGNLKVLELSEKGRTVAVFLEELLDWVDSLGAGREDREK